jgi:hypothetical protein
MKLAFTILFPFQHPKMVLPILGIRRITTQRPFVIEVIGIAVQKHTKHRVRKCSVIAFARAQMEF